MLHLAGLHVVLRSLAFLAPIDPVLLAFPVLSMIAATGNTTTDIVAIVAQYGVLGAVMLDVLLTHKLFIPRGTFDEALKQRDQRILERDATIAELKSALVSLQNMTREEMLPALIKANEIQAQYIAILTDEHRRR